MIVLIQWTYEGKTFEETFEGESVKEAEEKFKKKSAGKVIFARRTQRKLGYYKEFRDC